MKKLLLIVFALAPSLLQAELIDLDFTEQAKECIKEYSRGDDAESRLANVYAAIPSLKTLIEQSGILRVKIVVHYLYIQIEVDPSVNEQELVRLCAQLKLTDDSSYVIRSIHGSPNTLSKLYEFEDQDDLDFIDRSRILDGSFWVETKKEAPDSLNNAPAFNWRTYGSIAAGLTLIGAFGIAGYTYFNKKQKNQETN